MPTNRTDNYALSQWERSDRILMEDFNADNAKIDAALHNLEERVSLLDRLISKLTFFTGRLALSDVEQNRQAIALGSSINEQFLYSEHLVLTGPIRIEDGAAVLEGEEVTGSVTCSSYSPPDTQWSQARMWIERTNGGITVKVNGSEMKPGRSFQDLGSDGFHVYQEFSWTGPNPERTTVSVTLELDRGTRKSMKVYGYSLMFF